MVLHCLLNARNPCDTLFESKSWHHQCRLHGSMHSAQDIGQCCADFVFSIFAVPFLALQNTRPCTPFTVFCYACFVFGLWRASNIPGIAAWGVCNLHAIQFPLHHKAGWPEDVRIDIPMIEFSFPFQASELQICWKDFKDFKRAHPDTSFNTHGTFRTFSMYRPPW